MTTREDLRAAYMRIMATLRRERHYYHSLHAIDGMERYDQAIADLEMLGRAIRIELEQPEQPALIEVPKLKKLGGY